MSFGTSTRLELNKGTSQKPVIFWQQQAMEAKKRKPVKSNKQTIEQKFPTRRKDEPPGAAPTTRRTAAAPPRAANAARTTRPKAGNDLAPGTVTLTQAQLDAILTTVGTLVTQNEELQKSQNAGSQMKDLDPDVEQNVVTGRSESIGNILHQQETKGVPGLQTAAPEDIPGLGIVPTNVKTVEPVAVPGLDGIEQPAQSPAVTSPQVPKAHMTKAELKRLQWEREREEASKQPLSPGRTLTEFWSNEPQSTPRSRRGPPPPVVENKELPVLVVPRAHLTRAERKRQEWQQERAENAVRDAELTRAANQGRAPSHTQVISPPKADPPGPSAGTPGVPRAHLTKAELKRIQWEKERAEASAMNQPWAGVETRPTGLPPPAARPHPGIGAEQAESSPQAQPSHSKAELKRLQWQKEREELQKAEQQGEYNPWGRPGAGAPIRDINGEILSDFNQRKDEGDVRTSQQAIIEKQRHEIHVGKMEAKRPAAIRSSFTIGAVAPDQDRFVSIKDQEKKAWLEQLELQREEKRLAKEREKEKRRLEDAHDTWADRFAPPVQQAPALELRTSSAPQVAPTSVPGLDIELQTNQQYQQQSALPVTSSVALASPRMDQTSYLRGQNVHLDEQTRRDMEEKRRRQMEHQEAVRAQVEEHKRKKAEERERRAREEIEEERRLQAERDALNAMHEAEKQKLKEKEEQQKRRAENLKHAMDAAAERAQREKHERRLRKLEQGGHDTSQINAKFQEQGPTNFNLEQREPVSQAKMTPRAGVEAPLASNSYAHVAPTSVPGLNLTPREVASTAAVPEDIYQQDHIIVPTKYKGSDQTTPRREFGVQTELFQGGIVNGLGRETSADIEYKGPFEAEVDAKKVRLKSSEQTKRGQQQKKQQEDNKQNKSGPQQLSQRPKWGTQTQKKGMKQSEKDPYFNKRKEQREAAKLQRQRELLEMAEKSMAQAKMRSTGGAGPRGRSQSQGRAAPKGRTGGSRAENQRAPSPPVPVLRARANQPSPPPQMTTGRRTYSPETVNHRSRMDTHRSRVARTTSRREAQENQPPPAAVNGRQSPPVPSLKKQQKASSPPSLTREADGHFRSTSPPIPAVQHRLQNDYNLDSHAFGSGPTGDTAAPKSKYADGDPTGAPNSSADFVPFVRTANILAPEDAEQPLPVSREGTAMVRARKAYVHNMQTANYGTKMTNYEDRQLLPETGDDLPPTPELDWKMNPIMNPGLVKDHPTGRQDRILQQLSDLRRGLMQKQRELEVASPLVN